MESAIAELHKNLEHERDKRYSLTDFVLETCKYSAKDHADYALAQLQVERDVRSLVEELVASRREISRLCGEVSSLRIQTDVARAQEHNGGS